MDPGSVTRGSGVLCRSRAETPLPSTFNNRLQPLEIKASSSAGNAFDITYSFVDPTTSKNAGHVNSITNNLDNTRSQTFTYDQLNRITGALTASTYATSPAHCWGESYTLDAWGNLNSIAATSNSAYTGCTEESGFASTADGNNHLPAWGYDASGNATSDGTYSYMYDAESQIKSGNGTSYLYDGSGRRVAKVGSKLYWYGSGGEILAETNTSGSTTAEYIFFAGKRVAMLPAGGNAQYYAEDLLGTSRVMTTNTGTVCYDADFYPYGGERAYTNNCPTGNNYKFEGKERDTETGNDDFGARYYSSRFGRWLSADWSSVPVPVPYANLTNPQTLNLYAMVSDDPESFADLDGHGCSLGLVGGNISCSGDTWISGHKQDQQGEGTGPGNTGTGGQASSQNGQVEANQAAAQNANQNANQQAQNQNQQLLVSPDKKADVKYGDKAREQNVDYNLVQTDSKGNASPADKPTEHKVELKEKLLTGDPKKVTICTGQCVTQGTLTDTMSVTAGKGHSVEKRFLVDGGATKIYDPATKKAYDFVRVDASVKRGFVFNYGNDPN